MTIVSAGETFYVDTAWYDSATSTWVSGSVLSGGSGGPIYMPGVFTVTDTFLYGNVSLGAYGLIYVQGGTAIDSVISAGGSQVVNGGVASGTVVSSGGDEIVEFGGVASGTVVSAGYELVEFGGVASGTVLLGRTVLLGGAASRGGGSQVVAGGRSSTRRAAASPGRCRR